MDSINLEKFLKIVDDYLRDFQVSENFDITLTILCNIAIIYYFAKTSATNLLRPTDGFSFESYKTPVFYVIMLTAWPTLQNFIVDASNAMASTVAKKQQVALNLNQKNFNLIDNNIAEMEKQFRQKQAIEALNAEEEGYFAPLLYEMSSIDDEIVMDIYKSAYSIAVYFDSFLYFIFYIISQIWLKITLIGGGIAFTVSLYSGGWTVLINWAKTVLSVTLWVPVSGLIMNLINSIMIKIIQDLSVPLTHRVPTEYMEAIAVTEFYTGIIRAISYCVIVTLVFIGLKIIMLAKVPSIISGWISGGNSVGSGFAAAFIPVAMAKTATKSATGAISSTVTTQTFKK